jgi:Holliday junction resolvasome RuvABC endonuclease subunit
MTVPAGNKLLAIDPSLTCSGWALFCLRTQTLLGVGTVRSLPATYPLGERLVDLQRKVEHILGSVSAQKNDVLVCEAPTTMRDPLAAIKVEQVRGLFEVAARSRQMIVPGRINPRSVQHEVMGLRGKQLERSVVKETAGFIVEKLYGSRLTALGLPATEIRRRKNQDIVDAVLVGTAAMSWIKAAERGQQSLSEYFHRTHAPRVRSRIGVR